MTSARAALLAQLGPLLHFYDGAVTVEGFWRLKRDEYRALVTYLRDHNQAVKDAQANGGH